MAAEYIDMAGLPLYYEQESELGRSVVEYCCKGAYHVESRCVGLY